MDNQLKDKQEKSISATADVGAYAPPALHTADIARHWNDAKTHPWREDWKKRAGIMLASRGVVGAVAFAAGEALTDKWMHGQHGYNPAIGFLEQANFSKGGNPLKAIAKGIDNIVGVPIKFTVRNLARPFKEEAAAEQLAKRAVHFRPTHSFADNAAGKQIFGRSLGAEVVGVTTGFFGMSVGNAVAQDIATWLDPNDKKPWLDEKGHFNLATTIKHTGRSLWNYATYRGGEDWGAAIPYVYFMKGLTPAINRFSPGWKYAAHANADGSFKVKQATAGTRPEVVGNFAKEGMVDFGLRFTVYNWFTLMYRELYQLAANTIKGRPYGLYGSPDEEESATTLGKWADRGKWVIRSVVKGTLFMLPASPIFAILRPTQRKDTGHFIDGDRGVMVYETGGKHEPVKANYLKAGKIVDGKVVAKMDSFDPVSWASYDDKSGALHYSGIGAAKYVHPGSLPPPEGRVAVPGEEFHPFKMGQGKLAHAGDLFSHAQHETSKFLRGHFVGGREFIDKATKASIAYTPYFIAKDMSQRYFDNARTDMVIEDMIDGATSLDWQKFKAGAVGLSYTLFDKPLPDAVKEAEVQRRIALGKRTLEEFTQGGTTGDGKWLSWKERVVTGKAEKQAKQPGDGASLPDTYKIARSKIQQKPSGYAEQEEMQKILKDSTPPTNSVH